MPISDPLPNVRDLPTDALSMPDPVKVTTAVAREACLAYEQARAERNAATSAIAQAEAADDATDSAAVAAGKELPKVSAAEKTRAAAEVAGRRVEATERVYRDAFEAMKQTIYEHCETWTAELESQRETVTQEPEKAITAYAHARAVRETIDGTIEALQPFRDGWARAWGGFPSDEHIERRSGGPAFVRDEVVRTVKARRRFSFTADQVDRLLAELELFAVDETPWSESINGTKVKDGPSSEAARVAAVFGGE